MSFWLGVMLGWLLIAVVVIGLLWREARKPMSDDDLFYDAADRQLDDEQTRHTA